MSLRLLDYTLPVHLDFTTLYGAALAIEENELKKGFLPLGRLLALSQIIEALVLYDKLQYEYGMTKEWDAYLTKLDRTKFMDLIKKSKTPLSKYTEQTDAEDEVVIEAAKWAAKQALTCPMRPVEWAVRFRSGTYEQISDIEDCKNPFLQRSVALIMDAGDSKLNENFNGAKGRLYDNHIGLLGFHVLMRIKLLEKNLLEQNIANYLPHFSRQPLIMTTQDRNFEIKRWSIKMIKSRRQKLLLENEPQAMEDSLSLKLSPIFLSCIVKAKNPEDIIEEALRLRDSTIAIDYRNELLELSELSFNGEENLVQEYKLRVRGKIQALQHNFIRENLSDQYITQSGIQINLFKLFHFSKLRQTIKEGRQMRGDRSSIFLNNILHLSMGVISSQERLREIFKISLNYDTDILTWQ